MEEKSGRKAKCHQNVLKYSTLAQLRDRLFIHLYVLTCVI